MHYRMYAVSYWCIDWWPKSQTQKLYEATQHGMKKKVTRELELETMTAIMGHEKE